MDHPLLVELASLRQTAVRFQHEAHATAIKLQRYSREASHLHEHATALEQENTRLAYELNVLRAHPDIPPHPAVEQAQELSLALRRVSDKIALTEDTLLQRTSELTHTRSELVKATHAAEGAFALAAHMRAREEACKVRERELEFKARASDEERKLVDLVVQEYADLVRKLEGRKSTLVVQTTLADNLQDGKSTLHGVLTAFSTESKHLHDTIAKLDAKVSDLQMTLDAERLTAFHDRTLLSQTKTELDKLNLEDQTAAKMVARYMTFSQATTNALQQQITTLRTRHASTTTTLELQLSITESQLASERARTARLQDALDELCEDLARESYGRRREVALRLALLSREEAIAEFMRRWTRRARESYTRCYTSDQPSDTVQEAFHRVVSDAESLLSTLDDDVHFSDEIRTSGSLARITLSKEAVDALRNELQEELQRRLDAVRKGAFSPPDAHLDFAVEEHEPTPSHDGYPNENPSPRPPSRSSVSTVGTSTSPVSAAVVAEPTERTTMQDSASTLATLFVDEEPKHNSPAVSILDIQPQTPLCTLPDGVSPLREANQTPAEDDIPTPIPAISHSVLDSPLTLVSELGATKHRYDTLQHAFRDCSLALKELKRTLATSSPSSHSQTSFRQHLETALARIDDYDEDARVELEIRIADEELTARGFETVLSVPGALVDGDERAEVEANARAFVDGTDEGVARALEKFGKKLEDVQHDIAVIKRALHALAMSEGEKGEEDGAGSGWTAWTAGLLGANTAPSRSPTPVQTFGAVMTSPRLRHGASEENPDRGPLAMLNLRIPMPSASRVHLGLGHATEGPMSRMYTMGGLRSSSVGVGVGLGGSSSPARRRVHCLGGQGGLGWGGVSLPLRTGNTRDDLGGVE